MGDNIDKDNIQSTNILIEWKLCNVIFFPTNIQKAVQSLKEDLIRGYNVLEYGMYWLLLMLKFGCKEAPRAKPKANLENVGVPYFVKITPNAERLRYVDMVLPDISISAKTTLSCLLF